MTATNNSDNNNTPGDQPRRGITSREFTADEVRRQFVEHIHRMIDYWDGTDNPTREKLEGVAFSILVALDGSTGALPAFVVAPLPHPDDKQYLVGNGENYYAQNDESSVNCNISGCLHEAFSETRN